MEGFSVVPVRPGNMSTVLTALLPSQVAINNGTSIGDDPLQGKERRKGRKNGSRGTFEALKGEDYNGCEHVVVEGLIDCLVHRSNISACLISTD